MSTTKIKIQLRRDTTANWVASNPVLLAGEYAYATDTGYVTVGNGLSSYVELSGTPFATIRLPEAAVDGLEANYIKYSDVNGGKAALSGDNKLATIQDIAKLSGCIHFRGAFESVEGTDDRQAFIDKFAPVFKGDVAINVTNAKEYLATEGTAEAPATSADIVELGDERLYETKADAEAKLTEAKAYADGVAEDAFEAAKEHADAELQKHVKACHVPDDITFIEGTTSKGKCCGIFANGIPVVIREGATPEDVDVWYDNDTKHVTKSFADYPGGIMVYGGTGNEDDTRMYLPSTSIIMESGTVTSIFAGSVNSGNVGVANVIVKGGTVKSGVLAGRSDGSNTIPQQKNHFNNIGLFNCTIDGGNITMVYGGSNGFSTANKSVITVNAGEVGYLTAGGANGTALQSIVNVNGGTVGIYQSVNRGSIADAVLNMNGGTIQTCFAGGETEDSTVTGSVFRSVLNLLGGTVAKVRRGKSGSVPALDAVISGKYATGVVSSWEDDDLKSLLVWEKGISDLGQMAFKDYVTQSDLSGLFTFDCGTAAENN